MIHPRNIGNSAFNRLHDLGGYLGRGGTRLADANRDDRDVDIGHLSDRQRKEADHTDNTEHQKQGQRGDRAPDCPCGHVHWPVSFSTIAFED